MTPTSLPLSSIRPSKTNRPIVEDEAFAALTRSIRKDGVLEPIIVRPAKGNGAYELIAGGRRTAAARAAGFDRIPVIVKDVSDEDALALQLVENLLRKDLTPLEEAEHYELLMKGGMDVGAIAERIGMSAKWVYDRRKLTDLIPEAKKLLAEGKITAGHAILLARLKPEDQKRCVGPDDPEAGGLFTEEHSLFDPEEMRGLSAKEEKALEKQRGPYHGLKAVSVRELIGWIDRNVKLEASDVDQMVFPETAEILQAAATDDVKVLRITYEGMTPEAVREGPRVILGRSWERADGQHGSKSCAWARLAQVVIGPHRGEAFAVCTEKKKCATHWPDHVRALKAAAKAAAKGGSKASPAKTRQQKQQDNWEAAERKQREKRARQEAERKRYTQATPAILDALAVKVKSAPIRQLGDLVIRAIESYEAKSSQAERRVPRGTSAEDLVRHAAFIVLLRLSGYHYHKKVAGPLGVNVQQIVDNAVPKPVPAKEAPKRERPAAKRATRKGK